MGRADQEKRRRERFYKAGAESLAALGVKEALGGYVCPQCCRVFSPGALDARELTLEHVPSQRLGGKQITLTCVTCNPGAGTRLDAHVAKERSVEEFHRRGPGTWRGTLVTGNDVAAPGTATWSDGSFHVTIHNDLMDAARHQATIDYLDSKVGQTDWKFRFRLPSYNARRALVGHLRTAYLAAFAKFGYSFILNPIGMRLRSQIESPDKEEIDGFLATTTDPVDANARALIICDEPFPALAVQTGRRFVILPWPPSGVDPYDPALRASLTATVPTRGKWMDWPSGMELHLDRMIIERRNPAAEP